MAGGMEGTKAGRVYVELGVYDQLGKGLARAKANLTAFAAGVRAVGQRLTAAGGAVLGFGAAATRSFAAGKAALYELSERTGVSVEALSELGYAAKLTGVEGEALETALRRMSKTVGDASFGSKSATDALGRLGLKVSDLKGMKPDKMFEVIGDRIISIRDPAERAAMAVEIFGRNGTAVLPMLAGGAKGLQTFRAEARALGLTVSRDTAAQAYRLEVAMTGVTAAVTSAYSAIGAALTPAATALAERAARVVSVVRDWIKAHQVLICKVIAVAAAVAAAGIAFLLVGRAIGVAISVFSGLISVGAAVIGVLKMIPVVLAAIFSPLGLTIGCVLALGLTFLYVTGSIGKACDWLVSSFKWLYESVSEVFDGIANAIAAGDLQLAAQVAWAGIKVAFEEGCATIERIWLETKQWLIDRWLDFWHGSIAIATDAYHWIQVGAIYLTTGIASAWDWLKGKLEVTWESIKNIATHAWNAIKAVFDESYESAAEASNAAADQALVEVEQKVQAERKRFTDRLEADKKRELEAEDRRYQDQQRRNVDADQKATRKLHEQTQAGIAASRQELERAKKELEEALKKAKGARTKGGPKPPKWMEDVQKLIDEINDLENQQNGQPAKIERKISVLGQFGGQALFCLAVGGNYAARTANAVEEVARNTRPLRGRWEAHFT